MKTKCSLIRSLRLPIAVFLAGVWPAGNPLLQAADLDLAEALDAPGLAWTTGGAAPWFAQSEVTHDGAGAAQGAVQIERDRSWIETTVNGAGQIGFWWKTWTAWPTYDRLAFYIDGELAGSIPGDTDWEWAAFAVPAGAHTLRWVFEVDSEPWPTYGAWLDEVQFTPTEWPPPLNIPTNCGQVVAWGSGSWNTTNVPPDLGPVAAVSAGMYHSLALITNGAVVAWGGQGTDYQEAGQVPPGLSNVVAISAGGALSVALKADGSVVAWGLYGYTNVPSGLHDAIAISAGSYHGLALRCNGRVAGWGQSEYGQTSPPEDLTNAVAIAAGGHHSLALRANGTVVGFGYNGSGETVPPAGLSNVIAIAAGAGHSLALRADGAVVAWGWNYFGQRNVPAGLSNVVAISAGEGFSLALRSDGSVVAWGRGDYGQTNLPAGLTNVFAIDAGTSHSLALVPFVPPLTLAEAVNAPHLEWTTGGAVPWWPERHISHDGHAAAQGTVRVMEERSWIATTLTGPARISFYWKFATVWPTYDRLAFYIDNTLLGAVPANTDWERASFLVPPGEHDLKWVYEVDSEPYVEIYFAWLDEVTIETNVVITPPSITRQPRSQTVPVGGDAFFSVGVEGTPPMRYHWQSDGAGLEGETTNQLLLLNVQPAHAGPYNVTVDNGAGVAVSDVATLTVVPAPTRWAWAGQGGGAGYVNGGGSVAVDRDGNLFVTGSFSEEGHFGPFVLPNSWVTRFFLAKYDPAGNVLWVRTTTGAPYSASYGALVAADAAGNAYVAGTFADAMGDSSRARIAFGAHSVTNVGWFEDVFLVKYDSAGEAQWARRMGGPRQEFVYDLAVDAAGNAWITGGFGQAKYDSTGTLLWAQNVSGLTGVRLALDAAGNAYLSGRCSGPVTLDGVTVGPGLFVVKYSPASDVLWARTGALNELGPGCALACDVSGNLLLAGGFQGTASFEAESLTASDSNALFLVKYDFAGHAVWAREVASSAAGLNAQHLFFDGAGQLYLAAGFDRIVSFGDAWLSSRGSDGVFLAQFDATGERRWAVKLPAGAGTGGRAFAADTAARIFNTGSFSGTVAFGANEITCPYVNAMYLARLDGNLTSVPALAVRALPRLCQPGVPFTVRLSITPHENTLAYAVADQPPAGWAVSNVSDDGVFDGRTGAVKFGPWFDHEPRVLSYDVTPPPAVSGPPCFFGTISADGLNTAISGDQSVEPTPLLHPADNNPADSTMTEGEVAAYSAAWRHGQVWPAAPNPIPIAYVARAAALAGDSGCYALDPSAQPPMCWVPCDFMGLRARSVAKTAAPSSEAVSSLPAVFVPGEPLRVSIAATPAPGVKAFALEDILPAGWMAAAISHGGEFNPAQRRVKWGPFFDSTPRKLGYHAVPPASASGHFVLAGQASFEGANQPVTGQRHTASSCRLAGQGRAQTSPFHLTLATPPGAILQVEASTNLAHWVPLTLLTNLADGVEFRDPAAAAQPQRFYRAVLLQ